MAKPKRQASPSKEVMPMDDMLTLAAAAEAIGKSPRTIRRYIDEGILQAFVAGKRGLMVRQGDVSRLLTPYTPKASA